MLGAWIFRVQLRRFPGRTESLALSAARAALMRDTAVSAAAYEQLAGQSADPLEQSLADLAAARMWESNGRYSAAAARLRGLLRRDPNHAAARLRYNALFLR